MNNKNILIGIVVVIIVLGGALFFLKGNGTSNVVNTQSQNSSANQTSTTPLPLRNDIKVTSTGFEPATLTVKKGTNVIWTNNSGTTVTVNSDLHPTHLLWPFLNLGAFDDGSTVSVVFDKTGTYTYHNHLNASQKGTIIVE